jgi:hypothetical protein
LVNSFIVFKTIFVGKNILKKEYFFWGNGEVEKAKKALTFNIRFWRWLDNE